MFRTLRRFAFPILAACIVLLQVTLFLRFSIVDETKTRRNAIIRNLTQPATATAPLQHQAIPIISFGVTVDEFCFVRRLLLSIDFPVDRILILIGNADHSYLQSLRKQVVDSVEENAVILKGHVELAAVPYNPGCAVGVNLGLRAMMSSDVEWALITNNDIVFPSGALAEIYRRYMEREDEICGSEGIEQEGGQIKRRNACYPRSNVGVIFLNRGWSIFIFPRWTVEAVGYFDENFYPAYYEDTDYAIRLRRTKLKKLAWNDVYVGHSNDVNETKKAKYKSGTTLTANKLEAKGSSNFQELKKRGVRSARNYLHKKWCYDLDGKVTKQCPQEYDHPWNNASYNLEDWTLEKARRQWILTGRQGHVSMEVKRILRRQGKSNPSFDVPYSPRASNLSSTRYKVDTFALLHANFELI
eukprot:TRINITY_DN30244_c0_g1_i1.p1 TRINITY_DN30244_c0_g1~~TRINITY_DN30244_c0_g1_i1.p1  ORF type:complete len:414 (+),score=52.42 TRINITY_DN30244_c0_g1_i1:50-1291(+)